MVFTLDFEFISGLNHAYTFVISPAAAVYSVYAFASFNLFIEEIVSNPLDTYYFNSLSQQSFKFENQQSGSVSINLKNTSSSWRINLNGTALEFQKESLPGSNVWITKSQLI